MTPLTHPRSTSVRPCELACLRTRLVVTCHLPRRRRQSRPSTSLGARSSAADSSPHKVRLTFSTASKVGRHPRRPRARSSSHQGPPSLAYRSCERAHSTEGLPTSRCKRVAPSAAHGQEGRQLGLLCPHPSAVLTNSTCIAS